MAEYAWVNGLKVFVGDVIASNTGRSRVFQVDFDGIWLIDASRPDPDGSTDLDDAQVQLIEYGDLEDMLAIGEATYIPRTKVQ